MKYIKKYEKVDIEKDNNYVRYIVKVFDDNMNEVASYPFRYMPDAYEVYNDAILRYTDKNIDRKIIIVEEKRKILSEEEIKTLLNVEKYNL
jgi:hypothetical protein